MIVKNDKRVHQALVNALNGKRNRMVVKDANANGIKMAESNLSRYLKYGNVTGSLSEVAIIWLCEKYGVKLNLNVDVNKKYFVGETVEFKFNNGEIFNIEITKKIGHKEYMARILNIHNPNVYLSFKIK